MKIIGSIRTYMGCTCNARFICLKFDIYIEMSYQMRNTDDLRNMLKLYKVHIPRENKYRLYHYAV